MKITDCRRTSAETFKPQRLVFWMTGGGSAESDAAFFLEHELPRRQQELERLEREKPDAPETELLRLLCGVSGRAAKQIVDGRKK